MLFYIWNTAKRQWAAEGHLPPGNEETLGKAKEKPRREGIRERDWDKALGIRRRD